MTEEIDIRKLVQEEMGRAGVDVASIQVRTFPGEVIVLVEVVNDFQRAVAVAEGLDSKIESGFVTVRRAKEASAKNQEAR